MCLMASICFLTMENYNVYSSETKLGNGSVKKAYFLSIPHLSQVEPQVALLDH